MTIPSTVSFQNLTKLINVISESSGKSIPAVVDHEIGRILEKSASLTPMSSEGAIVANAMAREWGTHKTGFPTKRKFRGNSPAVGFKKYKYSNRFPDALWDIISTQRLNSIDVKTGYIGISKQSWISLASMLGIEIKVTKKVRALPKRESSNFDTSRKSGPGMYSVSFRNAQPTINRIGGRGILRKAVNGRVGYFKRNMEKGVLGDLETLSKAYPGLKINSPGGGLE
jgi:hypothetical protein